MESKLLKIIFNILDRIDLSHPEVRNKVLEELSEIYKKDIVDTVNCYLDFAWSNVDKSNKDEIIQNYIKE